jgi:hypothetical protein
MLVRIFPENSGEFERGHFRMKMKTIRRLALVSMAAATLTLGGCGNASVSSVTENDSAIASASGQIESAADLFTTDSSISSAAEASQSVESVISPQVIPADEITSSASASESTDSSASSDASGTDSTTSSSETVSSGTAYTNAGINMRAEASSDSSVLGTIEPGETVTVISTEGSWTKVEYGGVTGYVSSQYLTTNKKEAFDAALKAYGNYDSYYGTNTGN